VSREFADADTLADALIERVGRDIVLGLPVGLGKAIHVANALYSRARNDPSIRLTIFTALTLERPRGGNELARRFVEPLTKRLYDDWPALDWVPALRDGSLPANVRVREFYFRPAAYLGSAPAQRLHASINYSHVARELERLGVNVIAQLVSARPESPGRLSLGSNPEVTLDLLPYFEARRERGETMALVAQVNRNMPYMTGDADVDAATFDLVLDDEALDFGLFGAPNAAVGPADYAIGMQVASLVPDGGTIQLGIGSLSDAVAHCLKLRNESPEVFAGVLARLPGGSGTERRRRLPLHVDPFSEGLYACSELMSDALFSLFEAGILRRPADESDPTVMHAGFFFGSRAFYEALRGLPEEDRLRIAMKPISFVNTLFGDEKRKRAQRRDAHFINETMMATLMGSAVSDGLEDGRVVSGVGGQFDFISQGLALEGGRSVLVLHAQRTKDGRATSNLRWTYGHATVPRHHRDVFVTEYGVAAVRGLPDEDVIAAMLDLADARFQDELLGEARDAGKIGGDYRVPADGPANTADNLDAVFGDPDVAPHFPRYPLGTDLTGVEQRLAAALGGLKKSPPSLTRRAALALRALVTAPDARHAEALGRMGLDAPETLRERILAGVVADALEKHAE